MFWKLVISLLKLKDKDYIRTIRSGESTYIVNIHKFISAEDELTKWKDALENPKA